MFRRPRGDDDISVYNIYVNIKSAHTFCSLIYLSIIYIYTYVDIHYL